MVVKDKSFIDSYIDYAEEITDAPVVFHKYVAYSILSASLGNKVYFQFGDLRIYPNLWILLMAPSSLYRKSTCLGIGSRILTTSGLEVILPNEFTQERLVETLSKKPQGLFVFYEFMTLVSALDKDYMISAKSFLTELFDSPQIYTRHTKSGDFRIENPCISIMAGTTTEWFLERMKEKDMYGGFLTRFIYIPCNEKDKMMAFPPDLDIDKRQALAFKLEQYSQMETKAVFSEEARKLQEDWYEQHCVVDAKKHVGVIGSFINRLQIYILKLSVLEEISHLEENPTETLIISKEAMERALESGDFLEKSLSVLCSEELVFGKYQENRKRILKHIKAGDKEGISKSALLQSTRLSKRDLEEVLNTLVDEETIEEEDVTPAGGSGRKKTIYRAT